MKSILSFLVVFAIICVVLADLNEEWAKYKVDFEKKYDNPLEDGLRKELFRISLEEIKEHNALYAAKKVSYSKGVNQFTDLTDDERSRRFMRRGPKPIDKAWLQYKEKFNKSYEPIEDSLRQTLYHRKVEIMEEHNKGYEAGKVSWSMGLNQYTDRTKDEMKYIG